MMASRGRNWNCAGKLAGAKGPCVGPATVRCGSCGAPNYCSPPHQIAHWKEHWRECSRMAQQMAKAGDLLDFPFTFTVEVTQRVDDGAVTICSFLERRELHLKGLWQGECKCADSMYSSCYSAEWQLPSSMCPCTDPSRSSERQLSNWTDYFTWRQLSFDSPVALLLHWPLTLYYALSLFSQCMPTITKLGSRIHVHYLGPEKELQILQVFAELMALLPGTHVYIDMVGPAVPASRCTIIYRLQDSLTLVKISASFRNLPNSDECMNESGIQSDSDGELLELAEYPKCVDPNCMCKARGRDRFVGSNVEMETTDPVTGRLTLKLWRGLYHDRYLDLGSAPDFVLAPNAGLAAFPSWQPTMKLLSSAKTPAIFTDYCEEAAALAACALSSGHQEMLTYPVQPNPFRQPFSVEDKLLNLPSYSNGFIFGIK